MEVGSFSSAPFTASQVFKPNSDDEVLDISALTTEMTEHRERLMCMERNEVDRKRIVTDLAQSLTEVSALIPHPSILKLLSQASLRVLQLFKPN